jgi:hypothetical protein
LAACIVMENESHTAFEALLAEHLDRLQPADGLELGFIEEMASASWRMRRAWGLETRIFENHAKAQPPGEEIDRMAAVFTDPATLPGLGLMNRYETRLHCIYQRALHNFLLLRAAIPNEPNPSGADDRFVSSANLVSETSCSLRAAIPNEPNPGGADDRFVSSANPVPETSCSLRAAIPNEPNPISEQLES